MKRSPVALEALWLLPETEVSREWSLRGEPGEPKSKSPKNPYTGGGVDIEGIRIQGPQPHLHVTLR